MHFYCFSALKHRIVRILRIFFPGRSVQCLLYFTTDNTKFTKILFALKHQIARILRIFSLVSTAGFSVSFVSFVVSNIKLYEIYGSSFYFRTTNYTKKHENVRTRLKRSVQSVRSDVLYSRCPFTIQH